MIAPLDLRTAPVGYVAEPFAAGDERVREPAAHVVSVPLTPESLAEDLGPDGPVAASMRRFEDRPTQREMAAAISGLYNDGGVGLLEAGTGVGKSLGYLMPALRWARANGERTVVSTNTINLQEQLVRKDLPFLAGALAGEQDVRFALLKGWRNYLCLLRLEQAKLLGPALLDEDVSGSLAQISEWADTTTEGTLSDIPSMPRSELWDEISAEPDLCARTACPHYQRCFLFSARREAARADVVVVNHHLLMSDVAVRRAQQNWEEAAVIPAYTRLVVDEGHHLEDAASAHLGASTSRRTIGRLLARLDRRGRGLIAVLIERLSGRRDLLSSASLELVNARLAPSARAAREKSELLFDLLGAFLQQGGQPVIRLTDDFSMHPVWKGGLNIALTDVLREIRLLGEGLTMIRERLESSGARDETIAPLIAELGGVARRLDGAGEALQVGLRPPAGAPAAVRWVELKGREGNVAVTSVPLDLAHIFRDDLFDRVRTAVVTSATLAADGRFDFLAARLGLDQSTLVTGVYSSPFDYARQAVLAIPTDIPAPNEDQDGHFRRVVDIVRGLADASGGGLFVLFTSHKDVRAATAELRASGLDARFPILAHGEDGRDALLRRFQEAGNAILLGTASYWEGVDVPGDALRGLVIARLPFRVPTEPVTAAQCEAIEVRGGNSFAEYMLPHASLRLKQGFGRLIRSGTDRGVVVLADPRVLSRRYGRHLVAGLPPAARISGTWARLLPQLQTFYSMSPSV